MPKMNSNMRAFLQNMKEGEVFEKRGFDLILKRSDFDAFFDILRDAEFFEPSRNPGPVEDEKPGYFRIPYWYPIVYLKRVAELSGERNDLALADKVMSVVRAVSLWRDSAGHARDNYATYQAFAEILGLVPTQAVKLSDIDFIPTWLADRFNNSQVGYAFAGRTLSHFIDSSNPDDWSKACGIVKNLTEIRWEERRSFSEMKSEPVTLVDDYWLKKIVTQVARSLGARSGSRAAEVFIERLREIFQDDLRKRASWLWRPAIEEHEQNRGWHGPENRFVEGLRDTLLGWVDADPTAARPFLEGLARDELEIVRRAAIFVIGARFSVLQSSFEALIKPDMFTSGHVHELYNLLATNFSHLTEPAKSAVVQAIREIDVGSDEDTDRLKRRFQRRWLSAIIEKGYEPADSWYAALLATPDIGVLMAHPDFNSYMTSGWGGSEQTSYTPQELSLFAKEGRLIDAVNSFVAGNFLNGPTVRALADALSEAVKQEPALFLEMLPEFLQAKRPYQYGVLNGFKALWDDPAWEQKLDWSPAWAGIISFCDQLLSDDGFWDEQVIETPGLDPTRNWIPPLIADLLRVGTQKDEKSYPAELLPGGWKVVQRLLSKSASSSNLDAAYEAGHADPMTWTINTTKGKAVEALFDHCLRACRVSDANTGGHQEEWSKFEPVFEDELDKCETGNYEFSTLVGAYISQTHYLNAAWCERNVTKIFPSGSPQNCFHALGGLAFAPSSIIVYNLLIASGVIDWALRQNAWKGDGRESLLQRIALSYLWAKEDLDGPRIEGLFARNQQGDLDDIARYFWSIRGQPLTDVQKELILAFWSKCVGRQWPSGDYPATLMSRLGLLSYYIDHIGDRELTLLQASAPHVKIDYNADRFLAALDRLADQNLAQVAIVLGTMLETYQPQFDYENRLINLVKKLAHGGHRIEALRFSNKLIRSVQGMDQLYKEILSAPPEQAPH